MDSEHSKNIGNEGWRNSRLWRVVSHPGSTMNRFTTGNINTLAKESVRE